MFDRGMKKEYGIAEVLFECQNYFLAVWHFVNGPWSPHHFVFCFSLKTLTCFIWSSSIWSNRRLIWDRSTMDMESVFERL